MGQGGATVVLQWPKEGIDARDVAGSGETACIVTVKVVALRGNDTDTVSAAWAVGHNGVGQVHTALPQVDDSTTANGGGVACDGTVGQGYTTATEDRTAGSGRVVGDGTVGQSDIAAAVDDPTSVAGSRVAHDTAVGQGYTAATEDRTAAGGGRVVGDGAVGQSDIAAAVDDPTSVAGSRVAHDTAVGQGNVAAAGDVLAEDSTAGGGRVARDTAVGQGYTTVPYAKDPTPVARSVAGGRVTHDTAVGQGYTATAREILDEDSTAGGGRVVGDGALGQGYTTLAYAKDPTSVAGSAAGGRVAHDTAVGQDYTTAAEDSTAAAGRVVRDNTAGQSDNTATVDDPTSVAGSRIASDDAVDQGNVANAEDPTSGIGRSVCNRHSTDGYGRHDIENARSVVATDRQQVGSRTVNGQAFGDEQFTTSQGDGLSIQAAVEQDGIAVDGIGDGLSQRTDSAVIVVGYCHTICLGG